MAGGPRPMTRLAVTLLCLVVVLGLAAPWLAPHPYAQQIREFTTTAPQPGFPMGLDDLGRDRLSRLLYATRVSVLLAPAAATISILVALLLSALAVTPSRTLRWSLSLGSSIFLSLPWIFLFIILRAKLPLNTDPVVSVTLTFALMGVAGWAVPSRAFTASILGMKDAGWLLQARAAGLKPWRIATSHAWPHLWALALAQFRILIPAYVLSEASLGLLGLGVADPMPSWGNLLQDLQHPDVVQANPWTLAPLGLLVFVMICLEVLAPSRKVAL